MRNAFLVVMLSLVGLTSCSTHKNTAASRNYQAFITRYNVYFNGDEHYKETLKEMEQNYEDDYTRLLLMHPAEAYSRVGAPHPSGSFDRSIEKAQKAIQLHSIKRPPRRKPGHSRDPEYQKWMKRSEYNPFLHNAWMMMGRSQYMNGDFLGAASTFYYVAKHFTWLPATVLEAKLWQARCYCAMDWLFEAEMILTRVSTDALTSSTLKELYNFTYSDFYIRSHDYKKAIPMLREAVEYATGVQKSRLRFLLGQLYAAEGRYQEAYMAFGNAAKGVSVPYRTKFNARISQSEVYNGKDAAKEVKALKRMARYGRNKEYLDRIYYAVGNLCLSRKDTAGAIANYQLAVDKSTLGGIDKAVAQIALGEIYFKRHRYDLAQPCYAEAVPVLPESYPGYVDLKRRSDVLDELGVYSQNVILNDSLLRLGAMSEDERMAVIGKIIADLKKRETDEAENARREEYLTAQTSMMESFVKGNAATPNNFNLNVDKSWYFYNPTARNAGRTEFQRRWGARKLEDDWRRHDKHRFSVGELDVSDVGMSDDGNGDPIDSDEPDGPENIRLAARRDDPHYPEYYINQIPLTEVEKNTAREVIQEGLFNSGLILKDRLDDFEAADAAWQRLMNEYPENVYRLDIYYNEYLMDMRRGRYPEAEEWRKRILAEFPGSKVGIAMRDPRYIEAMREMESRQESLYRQTYEDYLGNRNTEVHDAYRNMADNYPLSPLMPKFMFLNALAFVTENKPSEFKAALKELLEKYPDSEFTSMASAYLKGLAQGRELQSDGDNVRSLVWNIRLTNDSVMPDDEAVKLQFEISEDVPHYVVLLSDISDVSQNQLLYEVARHNFSTYMVRDFDLDLMNFSNLGLLVVKGLDNMEEAMQYRQRLAQDASFSFGELIRPVIISRANFELLINTGASFEDYLKFMDTNVLRDTHESVVPPSEYLSPDEMFPPEGR